MSHGTRLHKDRVNHCFVCEEGFADGDTRIRCTSCGRQFHEACHDLSTEVCPRCGGDAWLDAAEF